MWLSIPGSITGGKFCFKPTANESLPLHNNTFIQKLLTSDRLISNSGNSIFLGMIYELFCSFSIVPYEDLDVDSLRRS